MERYNRTILAMLRSYVNEHQDDWDDYAQALSYAYNSHVHRSTGTTPFDLVLSRPPPDFALHHDVSREAPPGMHRKDDFVARLQSSMRKARASLLRTQSRYKRDFDRRVRKVRKTIRAGDYVFLDPTDGSKAKTPKLKPLGVGPYRVLTNDSRTLVIDRDGKVERVNISRVTYAPPPPQGDLPQPYSEYRSERSDLRRKNREGPTYVVDDVTDHREVAGEGLEFEVQWYGYPDATWEPRANLPEELVSRYFAKRRRQDAQA